MCVSRDGGGERTWIGDFREDHLEMSVDKADDLVVWHWNVVVVEAEVVQQPHAVGQDRPVEFEVRESLLVRGAQVVEHVQEGIGECRG